MLLNLKSVLKAVLLIQILLSYNAASAFGLKFRMPPKRSFISNIHAGRQASYRSRNLQSYPRGGADVRDEKLSIIPEPCMDLPSHVMEPKYALLFIDRFCHYHGGYLAAKARDVYGVVVINAISTYVSGYMTLSARQQGADHDESSSHLRMTIPSPVELEEWKMKIPYEIMGIICESDSGLEEAELLGEAMEVRFHNGHNLARRDKFLMNNVAATNGLRTVEQRMCSTLDEAIQFATELGVLASEFENIENPKSNELQRSSTKETSGSKDLESDLNAGQLGRGSNAPSHLSSSGMRYCVIKPTRGVASDDVYFCSNMDDVKAAFEKVQGTAVFGSITGEKNDEVLVQEFAAGTEYAIDIVSKNGQHKVAALWRYDKRQANGASFVYFATELVDAQTPEGKLVCEYAMKSLDALDLKHGLTHSEFIVDADGVRLVEVNCRQHNTNFAPLTMAAVGYNSLDLLLAAYLGDLPDLPIETEHLRLPWDEIPDLPMTRACGAVVHLVCFQEGELVEIRQEVLDEIEKLPSVYAMEVYDHFEVGSHIEKTIDIRSDSGWVHLINDDEEQFKQDYGRIVELMPEMFVVKETA